MTDLATRLRMAEEQTVLVRGNQGYGRKPNRGALARLAADAPVAVHHYDDATGLTTINTVHDPNPVVDEAKRRMNSGHDGYTKNRAMKHVAFIPLGIVARLYQQGINPYRSEDWHKVAEMLDDPAWWFLRTSPGTISRRPVRHYPLAREGFLKR